MSESPALTTIDGAARRGRPRLAVVSRNDPLTSYLHAALADRFDVVADLDVQLTGLRRAAVAGLTVRPTWSRWSESFIKSNLGYRARSLDARRRLDGLEGGFDVVLQTHALFDTGRHPAIVYADCTYRQAMSGWPEWTLSRPAGRRRWLERETAAYRRAPHVFAFNDDTRASLVDDYGVEHRNVTVVGAGANFADTAPPARELRADRPDPVILFVGKDFVRKGGPLLLRAFERVRQAVPGARLRIVGCELPGPVPPGVEVLGLVSDRDRLERLYLDADVFCLPSRFDPGAIVVLEAMAHGVPCVITRDASQLVHDLVDDGRGGVMVETGDEAGLVTGLVRVLSDPAAARRMATTARAAVLQDRMWRDVADRMAPAIEAAAARRSVA